MRVENHQLPFPSHGVNFLLISPSGIVPGAAFSNRREEIADLTNHAKNSQNVKLQYLVDLPRSMPRSDHFKGAVYHHECFGVDIEDDIFQFGEFRQRGDGKDHFFRDARISPMGL